MTQTASVVDLSASTQEEGQSGMIQKESIWTEATLVRVQEYVALNADINRQREALNAKKKAGITGLIDDGFNKDAIEAVIKYANTPEDKRENFDLTYQYVRRAVGLQVQDDLFTAALQQEVKVFTKEKAKDDD